MDGDRFDAFSRALATNTSRRRTLKVLAAGVLGGAFGLRRIAPADAAANDIGVCYLTGRQGVPGTYLVVTRAAAERLKGRRGYVVCEEGERINPDTCECMVEEEEPAPACPAPAEMGRWCTADTCCSPPPCYNADETCGGACVVTAEATTACVSANPDSDPAPCATSSDCPTGQVCSFTCGAGNACFPLCSW
jgi:Cys-rich repeat protein